jgi:hypothetical protein
MMFPRFLFRVATGAVFVFLSGCVNEYALDDLRETTPTGPEFSKALFRNYAALARSFGSVGAAAGVAFDHGGSLELTEMDSNIGALANHYAEKAIIAARGSNVEPESGIDVPTHKMRDRLIRTLERGKDSFPVDAARAQADYDCWMMNATVAALKNSSDKCRASLEISIAKLEGEARAPAAAPPPVPAPDNSDKPAVRP